jgi:hypothetical protein
MFITTAVKTSNPTKYLNIVKANEIPITTYVTEMCKTK